MSNDLKGATGKFLLGLLLGATAGAAAAVLTAPRSGQETRTQLDEKASAAREALGRSMEDMKQKTLSQISVAKEKTLKLAHQAGHTINELVPRDTQIKVLEQISDRVKSALSETSSAG